MLKEPEEPDMFPLRKAKGFGGKVGANTTNLRNYPTAYGLSAEVTKQVLAEIKPD